MKVFAILLAVLAVIIGILISAFAIMHGQVSFAFDQARDALESYSIWHDHHLKILGPTTDIPGVFHGVFWYYLLAIPYGIFHAPEAAIWFVGVLLFLTVLFLWRLSQKLFDEITISSATIILFVSSPLFIGAVLWFSNPVLALLITPLLLLFLWNFFTGDRLRDAFLSGIAYGLLIQSEIAYGIFLIALPLYVIVFRNKKSFLKWVILCIGFILGIATFLLGEFKYHGAIHGFGVFLHGNATSRFNIVTLMHGIAVRSVEMFSYEVFSLPLIITLASIVIFFIMFSIGLKTKHRKQFLFLFIWIAVTFVSQLFNSAFSRSYYLFFPSVSALCLLLTAVIFLGTKRKLLTLGIVIVLSIFNVNATLHYIQTNKPVLPVQKEAILRDAKAVIEYTYQSADKKPFAIITMTNPLYINTTWEYLYGYYGESRYNYLPFWAGKDQTGILGGEVLTKIPRDIQIRFLIVEPIYGIPEVYIEKIYYDEDKFSDVIEEKHFGKYLVQKRVFHKDKPLPVPTGFLKTSPILYE